MFSHAISLSREMIFIARKSLQPGIVNNMIGERRARALRTTLSSALSTLITVTVGIISVSLTVRYLGMEQYGIWLTISSILTWLTLMDLGIGNSLTTKLSEALGRDQQEEIQNLVASAFWLFLLTGIFIVIIGIVLGAFLPWAGIFNVKSPEVAAELPLAMSLALVVYGVGFPLSITKNIYNGYQEGYYSSYWSIAASFVSLAAIVVVSYFDAGLPLLVLAVFGSRQVVLAVSAIFLFVFHRPGLMPKLQYARKPDIHLLLSVGGMFVILQIANLLNTQTDNLIIIRLLGPEEVAIFGTLWRLFSYVQLVQLWILMPLWPAYGEAYARNDIYWMRRTLKYSLLGVMTLTIVLSSGLVVLAKPIIQIWAGETLLPSSALVVGVALLQIVSAWTFPFVVILNGIGRLRNQIFYVSATAFLGLVFRIIFVSWWGLWAIPIGMLTAYAMMAIWMYPLEVRRVLREDTGKPISLSANFNKA